jgi:hypothetical protein
MARKPKTIILNFRLPEDLHGELEREAAKHNCSLNTEMIERLRRSLIDDFLKIGAAKLVREGRVDQALTEIAKKGMVDLARVILIEAQARAKSKDNGEKK